MTIVREKAVLVNFIGRYTHRRAHIVLALPEPSLLFHQESPTGVFC